MRTMAGGVLAETGRVQSRFDRDLAEFAAVARRLDAERALARPIGAKIRGRLPLRPADVPDSWRTMGVAEVLREIAYEDLADAPERSVAAARLATVIAADLDETYPRVLRNLAAGTAWCALGSALRASGRPFQALAAFQRAHDAIGSHSCSDDAALIELGRAHAMVDLQLFAGATAAIRFAREIFSGYGPVFQDRIAECDELLSIVRTLRARRPDRRRWSRLRRRRLLIS